MSSNNKKSDLKKLDLVAQKLAGLTLTPLMGNGEIKLAIAAIFEPQTFTSDSHSYRVTIGVTKAILELEHPGHDRTNSYHAKLPAKVWETYKSADLKKFGSFRATIGFEFKYPFLSFGAKARGEAERTDKSGTTEHTTFDIITATPTGWVIGGKNGDPRQNKEVVAEPNEVGCLRGAYFTNARDEVAHVEILAKKVVVCALQEKPGSNQNLLSATLYCAEGGLRLEVENSSGSDSTDKASKVEKLREAFIAICAERATAGANLQGEALKNPERVNTDLYLARAEKQLGKILRAKK